MTDMSHSMLFLYGFILFAALLIGIVQWIRRRYDIPAVLAIILSLLLPLAAFLYCIRRPEGMNEIVYIWKQTRSRSMIGSFLLLGHLYLLVWILFGIEFKRLYSFLSGKIKQVMQWWKQRKQKTEKVNS